MIPKSELERLHKVERLAWGALDLLDRDYRERSCTVFGSDCKKAGDAKCVGVSCREARARIANFRNALMERTE